MEELRDLSLSYYQAGNKEFKGIVDNFYAEMDPKNVGYVNFKEFSKFLKTNRLNYLSSGEFFDELKQPGDDVLYEEDIITLFYIIHSNRPFCEGSCKKFIKGASYFTCVECYDSEKESTFSVCSQCFSNEKNYKHEHKVFLDPIALLNLKRFEGPCKNKHNRSSNVNEPKYQRSPSSMKTVVSNPCSDDKHSKNTNSTAIVQAMNQQSNHAKTLTLIQLGQLAGSFGSLAVAAAQLCTIM